MASLQAGTKENIIPDDATIKLNMRTFNEDMREYMLVVDPPDLLRRMRRSGAERPPEFTTINSYPLTENDLRPRPKGWRWRSQRISARTPRCAAARVGERRLQRFRAHLERALRFWFVGGTDPEVYAKAKRKSTVNKIPSNHSPKFAPSSIHAETGLQAMLTAASAWLSEKQEA